MTIESQEKQAAWAPAEAMTTRLYKGPQSWPLEEGKFHWYVSGPMTGLPNYNYPLFEEVTQELRREGWTVVSPHEFFGGDQDLTIEEYFREDIDQILAGMVSGIILLPGWENSPGACMETTVALALGKGAFTWNEMFGEIGRAVYDGLTTRDRLEQHFQHLGKMAKAEPGNEKDDYSTLIVNPPGMNVQDAETFFAPNPMKPVDPQILAEQTKQLRDLFYPEDVAITGIPEDGSLSDSEVLRRNIKALQQGQALPENYDGVQLTTEDRSVLLQAEEIINGARAKAYDHPIRNFKRIADGWSLILEIDEDSDCKHKPITPGQHALMMLWLKIARLMHTPDHWDSIVDLAGYTGTYEKVVRAEEAIANGKAFE